MIKAKCNFFLTSFQAPPVHTGNALPYATYPHLFFLPSFSSHSSSSSPSLTLIITQNKSRIIIILPSLLLFLLHNLPNNPPPPITILVFNTLSLVFNITSLTSRITLITSSQSSSSSFWEVFFIFVVMRRGSVVLPVVVRRVRQMSESHVDGSGAWRWGWWRSSGI